MNNILIFINTPGILSSFLMWLLFEKWTQKWLLISDLCLYLQSAVGDDTKRETNRLEKVQTPESSGWLSTWFTWLINKIFTVFKQKIFVYTLQFFSSNVCPNRSLISWNQTNYRHSKQVFVNWYPQLTFHKAFNTMLDWILLKVNGHFKFIAGHVKFKCHRASLKWNFNCCCWVVR